MRGRGGPNLDDSNCTPEHDAEIVARIARRDPEAETYLWHRFRAPTLLMLGRRTHLSDVAEDLWQETFIIVLQKLRAGGLEDATRLAAYVHKTALYVYIGWVRREIRRKTDNDAEVDRFKADNPSPPCVIQRDQVTRVLSTWIREMTVVRDREILLRHLRGESKDQICRDFGLTEAHCDRVLSRARKRLAELLIAQGVRREDLRPWLDDE